VNESPPLAPSRAANPQAQPGWVGAFRGIWLMTWRSQLTWRQLPARLGTLLVLPFLIYISMVSLDRRHPGDVSVHSMKSDAFYHWLLNFYFFLILPLACVRGCAPLIRDELQADTLGFLITRPVSRARLLMLKYASQVAWLEILLLVETLLLFAAGAARGVPSLDALLPLLLGVQMLAVPAWSALGLLLGQLTTRYMAAALLYGGVVEMGIGRIPTNINVLSIMRHLQTLLSQNAAIHGLYSWPPGKVSTALAALIAAPVIFLGMAALLFNVVEYHHAAEMQK
jgi:ABC-type transport system involved in multi-copper enzyme maturation permease subunit